MLKANTGQRPPSVTGPRLPHLVTTLGRQRWRVLDDFVRGGIAVLLLVVPGAVAAVDHHGLERVPTHAHATPLVGPEQRHVHGFEIPHGHVASVEHVASAEPVALELEARSWWAPAPIISPSSAAGALLVFALQAALEIGRASCRERV